MSRGVSESGFELYLNRDQRARLPSNSITLKFLCQKHNSDLSPYDSEAQKFFRGLRKLCWGHVKLDVPISIEDGVKTLRINGPKLEKWYAKTLLNLAAYKAVTKNFEYPVAGMNSRHLLHYLFRGLPLPEQYGLYALPNDADLLGNSRSLIMQVSSSKYKLWSNGRLKPWSSLPGVLYTRVFGMELVGNFNITQFEDSARDDLVIGKDFGNFPSMKLATKEPSLWGYTIPDLGDHMNFDSPCRQIIFEWPSNTLEQNLKTTWTPFRKNCN